MGEQDQTSRGRQFRFVRRIGTGGFGEVYLAEMSTASGFAKMVAIKLLKGSVSGNQNVAERMRDEARLLGMLHHRTIVQAEDLISISGRVAMVMEYIPGCNWSVLINPSLNPHPVPPRALLNMAHCVSTALHVAFHRPSSVTGEPLGVLHRDIKPSNIRLTPDGEFKVLDFGIACGTGIEREAHTTEYQLGSLNYMSPEQLNGIHASPASDAYGLGVTLFESIANERYGWAGENAALHNAKLDSRIAKLNLAQFGAEKAEVEELIRSAMAFDPAQRPAHQTTAEWTRELSRRAPGEDTEAFSKRVVAALSDVSDSTAPHNSDLTGQIVFEDDSEGLPMSAIGVPFMDEPTESIPVGYAFPPNAPQRMRTRRNRIHDVIILLLLLAITAMFGWTQMMQKDEDHGLGDRKDMVAPKEPSPEMRSETSPNEDS